MKKVLVAGAVVVLALAAVAYLFRDPIKQAAYNLLTAGMFLDADTDAFDPGPVIGSHFPGVQATYRGRSIRLIQEFAGPRGTLVIASRSLDWCPYCMRQMIQLQEHKPDFERAGIGMVAITYDKPALQQAFIDKFDITIPVLSDQQAMSFKTLGILNRDYAPGDARYGIPHPGMIVIDARGIVVGKLFIQDYTYRVDSAATLAFARSAIEPDAP